MKGKPLLPTLRTKKRYVVYEYISENEFSRDELVSTIAASYRECFGTFGLGKAGFIDTRIYDRRLKRGIIKINNASLDNLKTSTSMIRNINNKEITFRIVGVSGILKIAKEKYLSRR